MAEAVAAAIATTRDETTTLVRADFEAQAKRVVARHNEEMSKLAARNAELTAKVEVHEDSWMTGGQQQQDHQQRQQRQAASEAQLQEDREKIRVLEQNMAAKANEYMEALAAKEAEVRPFVVSVVVASPTSKLNPFTTTQPVTPCHRPFSPHRQAQRAVASSQEERKAWALKEDAHQQAMKEALTARAEYQQELAMRIAEHQLLLTSKEAEVQQLQQKLEQACNPALATPRFDVASAASSAAPSAAPSTEPSTDPERRVLELERQLRELDELVAANAKLLASHDRLHEQQVQARAEQHRAAVAGYEARLRELDALISTNAELKQQSMKLESDLLVKAGASEAEVLPCAHLQLQLAELETTATNSHAAMAALDQGELDPIANLDEIEQAIANEEQRMVMMETIQVLREELDLAMDPANIFDMLVHPERLKTMGPDSLNNLSIYLARGLSTVRCHLHTLEIEYHAESRTVMEAQLRVRPLRAHTSRLRAPLSMDSPRLLSYSSLPALTRTLAHSHTRTLVHSYATPPPPHLVSS